MQCFNSAILNPHSYNAFSTSFLSGKLYLKRSAQWQVCQFKCKSLDSTGLAKWQICQLFAQSLINNIENKTDKLDYNNFETNSTQNQLDRCCDWQPFRALLKYVTVKPPEKN